MTQTRYTLQQHHVNLKSSVKLSHVNMYHCESPASNIFPGHPYSKIIFIQKGQGQFYFGNQFLPVRENDLLLVNPDKQKFSVDVRESPLDFVILGIYDFPSKEKNNRDCKFVKEYLDSHYTENITLDILSKESKMNKYYLVHSFTKHFGCSPISYLNDKRIEESKNLLETTNHSIAAIASMIGFSSQSYFSQSFKKNTFMTPNEYRRASRQI